MKIFAATAIAVIFPISIAASLNQDVVKFIGDYFTYQNVRVVTSYTCSKYDSFLLSKLLMASGRFWVISADPEKPPEKATKQIIKRSYNKFGVFLDFDCPNGKDYLFQNSANRSLNGSYYWLIWSNTKFTSDAEKLNLNVDTEMTWTFPQPDHNNIAMYDLYKINYSWPINATLAGHWHPDSGIKYSLTQPKYERRQDLRGIVFTSGLAVNGIPTENLKEDLLKPENRRVDAMATYHYSTYRFLEQVYNFSTIIKPTALYGYVVKNGKKEGLTLMLDNHEVDLSISGLFISEDRYNCMDYINAPMWQFRAAAMFLHPPGTGYYGQALITPFEVNAWVSCGCMWVIVILVIRFVSWVETNTLRVFNNIELVEEEADSWSSVFMIIIGAITEQGTSLETKWLAWRMAFLSAFVLSIMVNINYSASLVSSLLNSREKTIRSTRDIIDSSLQFGAEDVSYSVSYFAMNNDPLIQELFHKKMSPPHKSYYPRDVALEKMREEPFAFHTEPLKLYPEIERTFTETEICILTEVVMFTPEHCYVVIPWGSPYKELVALGMRKAYQGGLVNYLDRVWQLKKPPCTEQEEFVTVDMGKISPAFLIVIVGVVISFLILLGERISHRRSKHIRRH